MNERRFQVVWRDGSVTADLGYDESLELIEARPKDWAGVRSMDYGKDCSPENVKLRQSVWGTKKK
jgi:hypothetical protein